MQSQGPTPELRTWIPGERAPSQFEKFAPKPFRQRLPSTLSYAVLDGDPRGRETREEGGWACIQPTD